MRRVVVKLGSSIVAGAGGEPREDVISRVAAAIAGLRTEGDQAVIVTSGAIASGMRVMDLPIRPRAIEDLQAASAIGQGRLHRTYEHALSEHGIVTAQVLLTFFDLSARVHYLNARRTLARLLDWGVVPVVNENDTTASDEITFGENDYLAAQVAILVSADLLVLATDIEGLYSADPRLDPDARLVECVEDFESLEQLEIGASGSALGSGGMRSKVVAADMATAAGIPTVICHGLADGALEAALAGRGAGTRFEPRSARQSSFKLWLRYAKPSHGTLVVDAGAARALREGGTSLLPVGIVEITGEFSAGDAVDIAVAREGEALRSIGKGICAYSAAELRRVKGLQSAAVRELLPRATEEAVHRDYMVLV